MALSKAPGEADVLKFPVGLVLSSLPLLRRAIVPEKYVQLRANKIIPIMEDAKSSLLELSGRLSNTKGRTHLGVAVQQHYKRTEEQASTITNLDRNIRMLERKNTQIDGEIQRISMLQGKINGQYSKIHGERLRLSKQLIDLESKNDNLEAEIEKTEDCIAAADAEIKSLNSPSCETIYYEIIRGFGVDFIKDGNNTVARIKNKEKSDVFYANIDGRPAEEACDEIWRLMS